MALAVVFFPISKLKYWHKVSILAIVIYEGISAWNWTLNTSENKKTMKTLFDLQSPPALSSFFAFWNAFEQEREKNIKTIGKPSPCTIKTNVYE